MEGNAPGSVNHRGELSHPLMHSMGWDTMGRCKAVTAFAGRGWRYGPRNTRLLLERSGEFSLLDPQ